MTALLAVLLASTPAPQGPLELRAIFATNAMNEACCLFELAVTPDGNGTLRIYNNGWRTHEGAVPIGALEAVRRAVQKERFFQLPEEIGPIPVDCHDREMSLRIGKQARKVVLFGCSKDERPDGIDVGDEVRLRAWAVWDTIRAVVRHLAGVEVE